MDNAIILIVVLVVLVGGTLAALGWWKLAAKAAPYKGEKGRGGKPPREEVHVIRSVPKDGE
jgi:hypothetical protein